MKKFHTKVFKKMLDKFGLSIDNVRLYSGTSLTDVMRDTNVSLKSYDELKSGTYVETVVSDNDTQADVGRLNQIREHLQNGDTFYEVFEDPNAYVTFGKDYPLQTT